MSTGSENETMSKAADTKKSVHLSASAGAGKTRALKDRYLALLDVLDNRGLNIDQAVAITFTDKAASEIKERVMHDLPEDVLKKIVRGRQDLRISTIHSFCMNLLKRYPLEAGLPPDFGVLDGRDQAYKIQKAIEDALEEADRDPGIMAPLSVFSADELISRVQYLISMRSKLKRMEIDAGGGHALLQAFLSGIDLERAEAELKELVGGAGWNSNFRKMEEALRSQSAYYDACGGKEHGQLVEANDIVGRVFRKASALASVYFNKDGSRRKKAYIAKSAFSGKDRAEYEAIFFEIQEMLEKFMALRSRMDAAQQAVSLIKLFQLADGKYQASKLREGVLDFDDLEIYAYALLQGAESPGILYWLDRKILHFLVDEFQDTSDIQWSILRKLTEEIFAGQGAEKMMSPTLFVVGDEKQSIYRFREANYRLIETVRAKIETSMPAGSREILTLDRNFRSTPEIIDTVNEVFGKLWGKEYQASDAERKKHRGSVRLIELEAPPETAAGPTEAEALAREIKSLVEKGTLVYEKNPKNNGWTQRPAGHGDCAVLIQSRTRLKEFEAALQAQNVPYTVIGGIGFYEEDEIQALMNVLFFLWNRDDALALAAALKSPLFGLSDKEIFDLMQEERTLTEGLKDRRPDVWELLYGWMKLAGLVPLANLMHRVIEETGAYIRFGRRNRQAIFNMDKLLDTAREFDRRGYTTLQDFVEWVKNIRRTEQREATADMNLPGFAGSVGIMTVHKAKGLEFPVVFLPGMNQQPRSLTAGPLAIIQESSGNARVAIKREGSPVYTELWEREKEELLREHQRLLYVAMTRARDHLMMIGTLNNGARPVRHDTWLSYLHEAAPKPLFDEKRAEQAVTLDEQCKNVPRADNRPAEARIQEPGYTHKGIDTEKLISNFSPLPESESREWRKATDFLANDESIEQRVARDQPGIILPLTRGTILHRCLEETAKTGSCDVETITAQHPEVLALPEDVRRRFIGDITRIKNAVLSDTGNAWIFEPRKDAYSELPFLYRKGHTLVSGVIDRVVVKEGTGYVVDYKSILVENEESLAFWLDHYRPQVRIYCEAVKEMFRLPRIKGFLLFLDSNRLQMCVEV